MLFGPLELLSVILVSSLLMLWLLYLLVVELVEEVVAAVEVAFEEDD